MPAFLQGPFAFLLVLGALIFIHEFGHFLMAKWLGIRVDVFSLGFGPRLLWIQRGDTEYRVSALPLGGYVKMHGENPDEELTDDPSEFLSRSKPQRFLVLVMGATFNILLAIGLVAVTFQLGIWEPYYLERQVVVGEIEPDSPAERAGLAAGDRIVRFNGQETSSWKDFQINVTLSPGQSWRLEIDRDGERIERDIQIDISTPYRIGRVGIRPFLVPIVTGVQPDLPAARAGLADGDRIISVDGEAVDDAEDFVERIRAHPGQPLQVIYQRGDQERTAVLTPLDRDGAGHIGIWALPREQRRYGLGGALRQSLRVNREQAGLLFTTLRKLFGGELSLRTLSGPVDIYKFSAASYRQGVVPFLSFMAMVSLQLGIINLLPIPVLDGGHIFILLIEGVVRRNFSMRVKERMMQVGFVFLLVFMGIVLYLDVEKNELLRKALGYFSGE